MDIYEYINKEQEKEAERSARAKRNSRFHRGSGCYKCQECGKMTRDTGHDEAGCQLCRKCYELSGLENSLNDGCITQEEHDKRAAEIEAGNF